MGGIRARMPGCIQDRAARTALALAETRGHRLASLNVDSSFQMGHFHQCHWFSFNAIGLESNSLNSLSLINNTEGIDASIPDGIMVGVLVQHHYFPS